MNKIIIITGVSGTGKSSLGIQMNKKLKNSVFLSLDVIMENIYDLLGFKNRKEKDSLKLLGRNLYKQLVNEAIERKEPIIIIEYPFKKEWIAFFSELRQQEDYELYIINMFAKDFDTIWNRLLKRENSVERHPSHYLDSYNLKNKENYTPYFEYNYDTLKKEYEELISNSINLGITINIEDIEKLDINDLIQKIKEKNYIEF